MNVTKENVDHFWENVVVKNFPDAKIKFKDKSMFMRILGILMFFNPSFMTKFITVVGNTVYVPTKQWMEESHLITLFVFSHEFVHMWDRKMSKLAYNYDMFSIGYVSPQLWALFSLTAFLAFVNIWFLLCLVFLVFLAPWPSPWRTDVEANGYAMTMFIRYITVDSGYNKYEGAERLAKHFITSQYYWMCRDKAKVKKMLIERYETLPQTHGGFNEVHQWVKTQLH